MDLHIPTQNRNPEPMTTELNDLIVHTKPAINRAVITVTKLPNATWMGGNDALFLLHCEFARTFLVFISGIFITYLVLLHCLSRVPFSLFLICYPVVRFIKIDSIMSF